MTTAKPACDLSFWVLSLGAQYRRSVSVEPSTLVNVKPGRAHDTLVMGRPGLLVCRPPESTGCAVSGRDR